MALVGTCRCHGWRMEWRQPSCLCWGTNHSTNIPTYSLGQILIIINNEITVYDLHNYWKILNKVWTSLLYKLNTNLYYYQKKKRKYKFVCSSKKKKNKFVCDLTKIKMNNVRYKIGTYFFHSKAQFTACNYNMEIKLTSSHCTVLFAVSFWKVVVINV